MEEWHVCFPELACVPVPYPFRRLLRRLLRTITTCTQYVSQVEPYLEQECSKAVHWLNLLLTADFDDNGVVMVEKKDIL